jgi:hypothetical protein
VRTSLLCVVSSAACAGSGRRPISPVWAMACSRAPKPVKPAPLSAQWPSDRVREVPPVVSNPTFYLSPRLPALVLSWCLEQRERRRRTGDRRGARSLGWTGLIFSAFFYQHHIGTRRPKGHAGETIPNLAPLPIGHRSRVALHSALAGLAREGKSNARSSRIAKRHPRACDYLHIM